jgi:hypothetical protein
VGILLLPVVILWPIAALLVTWGIVSKINNEIRSAAAAIFLFPAILLAPILDDIVGGMQFRALCEEKSVIKVDKSRAAGRTVYLAGGPTVSVSDVVVPITEVQFRYADVETNEVLFSYSILRAKGGWLIRALGILDTDSPITFPRSCGPTDPKSVFEELDIKYLEREAVRRPPKQQ